MNLLMPVHSTNGACQTYGGGVAERLILGAPNLDADVKTGRVEQIHRTAAGFSRRRLLQPTTRTAGGPAVMRPTMRAAG